MSAESKLCSKEVMKNQLLKTILDNNNNKGYLQVLFLQRAHRPFIEEKNGVNMELGKTNRLKALCMMQNNT